ncbi:MAG: hypothetical protein IJ801_06200 [Lachnospiraceae bacterium]|nr:hypothetical protein [Lachnospiraceae bacterium]
MNRYQFEQVARRMEKKYGKIRKGEEEHHAMLLFPMESNLLKVHRKYPAARSRKVEEGILLALHEIEMRITGKQADVTRFETEETLLLKNALLQAFDPFVNHELCEAVEQMGGIDIRNKEELENYYKEPVVCMLRIKESVKRMVENNGTDGYFDFIEGMMGTKIPDDEKMNYAVCVGSSLR